MAGICTPWCCDKSGTGAVAPCAAAAMAFCAARVGSAAALVVILVLKPCLLRQVGSKASTSRQTTCIECCRLVLLPFARKSRGGQGFESWSRCLISFIFFFTIFIFASQFGAFSDIHVPYCVEQDSEMLVDSSHPRLRRLSRDLAYKKAWPLFVPLPSACSKAAALFALLHDRDRGAVTLCCH